MIKDFTQVVADQPFFSGMEAEYIELVGRCGQLAGYQPGSYVARSGTEADSFFLVRHGKVALELSPPGREPFVFGSVSEGEMLGWSWLFEPHVWQFDARAVDRVGVIRFDGACLREKCDVDSKFGYDLVKRVASVLIERFTDTRLQLMDVYGNLP